MASKKVTNNWEILDLWIRESLNIAQCPFLLTEAIFVDLLTMFKVAVSSKFSENEVIIIKLFTNEFAYIDKVESKN